MLYLLRLCSLDWLEKHGQTPLIFAAFSGQEANVRALLKLGAHKCRES